MSNESQVLSSRGSRVLASTHGYLLEQLERTLDIIQEHDNTKDDFILDIDSILQRLHDWGYEIDLHDNSKYIDKLIESDKKLLHNTLDNAIASVATLNRAVMQSVYANQSVNSEEVRYSIARLLKTSILNI
jgi:biotin operon repressor